MEGLELTWKRSSSVWWLLLWRGTLGGMLLGGVLGFIIGFGGALAGWPQQAISTGSTIVGGLAGLIWSAFVVRMALHKVYHDFRIALVPRT